MSMLLIAFCKPIPEDGRIELCGYHSSLRAPGLGSLSKVDRSTESRDDFKYMTPIERRVWSWFWAEKDMFDAAGEC